MPFHVAIGSGDFVVPMRIRSNDGQPATGLTFQTAGLAVAYRAPGGSFVTISLTAASFVESSGAAGWYDVTFPASVRSLGTTALVRALATGIDPQFGAITFDSQSGNGNGRKTLSLTFKDENDEVMRNVVAEITSIEPQVSDTNGIVRFGLNPGNYSVAIFPPYGYTIPAPLAVTMAGVDIAQDFPLVPVSVPESTNPDACQCRLTVLTAHEVPITGAILTANTAGSVTFADDALIFPTSVQATSVNGVVLIYLIQGVTYNINVSYQGRSISFSLLVPEQLEASIPAIVLP